MRYKVAFTPKSFITLAVATALLAMLSMSAYASSHAPLNTLVFDEVPFQSVDDLTVAGVTFDFRIAGADSLEAFYNSFGPGALVHVSDPSLTGDSAGILTLDFDVPTATLQFGVALNTADSLSPGFQVELFDANLDSLGVIPVDVSTAAVLGFAEGLFDYEGDAISRAVIDFEHEPGTFALDNLTYSVIPEPSAGLLAIVSLLSCTSMLLRGGRATDGN